MLTVECWRGYRFCGYGHGPNEPSHVHVGAWWHGEYLAAAGGACRNIGFTAKELAELLGYVRQRQTALEDAWHGHFGA